MRPIWLLIIYLAVAASPLILAVAQGKTQRMLSDELAAGMALVAFAILIMEFVLSGRFRHISDGMGMDVTMRFHQLLARTALALIIVHPFIYRTPIGFPLPWDTTGQHTLGLGGASLATGIVAWIVLPVLVLTAIYRSKLDWKYETWRLIHGLGALLVVLLGTHHAIAAGRYSADPLLASFWLALLGVALLSLVWVYAIKPLHQILHPYHVTSVRRAGPQKWEVVVEPDGHAGLEFAAGQFVWLNIGNSPFSLKENPYSISSSPHERPRIAFLIQEAGDFSSRLGDLKPGTRAYLDGPHGNLTLKDHPGKGIALIGVGVGIAPLLSILREMATSHDHRPVVVIYGNRQETDIVYRDELDKLDKRPGITIRYALTRPPAAWPGLKGRVDDACIRAQFAFPEAGDWLYVLCGPPAMMEAAEDTLISLGVPAARIISERFRYD